MSQLREVECSICGSLKRTRLYDFDFRSFGLKSRFYLVRCRECGHVYNNPRLVTEELNQLYNRNYHKPGDKYNEHRGWILSVGDYLNEVRPWEGSFFGRALLDIGCGMGFFLKVCRDNGWQVKGIDVSSDGANYARNTLGLDVALSRFEDHDFSGARFDMITAFDLLEHMEDPAAFLRRCFGLLNPGGLLVLETPNFASIYRLITRRFWVGFNPYHIRFFTPCTIRRLAARCEFPVVDIHTSFNDLLAKRNIWRWVSNVPAAGALLRQLWQMRKSRIDYGKSPDIASISTNVEKIGNLIGVDKLIEHRNSFVGRRLLGDQLIVVLRKS